MMIFIIIWVFVVGIIGIILLFKVKNLEKYVPLLTSIICLPFTAIPLVIVNAIYKDIGSIILIAVVILSLIHI